MGAMVNERDVMLMEKDEKKGKGAKPLKGELPEPIKFRSFYKNHMVLFKHSKVGPDGRTTEASEWIEFERGEVSLTDPARIKCLRQHPEYGIKILEDEAEKE